MPAMFAADPIFTTPGFAPRAASVKFKPVGGLAATPASSSTAGLVAAGLGAASLLAFGAWLALREPEAPRRGRRAR